MGHESVFILKITIATIPFFSLLYHFNPRVMLLDSFLCVNCMKLDVDAVVFGRSHSQRAS